MKITEIIVHGESCKEVGDGALWYCSVHLNKSHIGHIEPRNKAHMKPNRVKAAWASKCFHQPDFTIIFPLPFFR
jgi:hypothetical protein